MRLKFWKQKIDDSFTYPYSVDKNEKKNQIIENLEKGILFEESRVFLNWRLSFHELENYCEQIQEKGDRTNYYLGEHQIMDGLICNLSVMRWMDIPKRNPFSEVEFFLGFDKIALDKIEETRDHLTELIGKPSNRKDWGNDEVLYEWKFKSTQIALISWERFAIHGKLSIGLKNNPNGII